jgi:hypothetical protein
MNRNLAAAAVLAFLALAALIVAGCGDSGSDETQSTSTVTVTDSTAAEDTAEDEVTVGESTEDASTDDGGGEDGATPAADIEVTSLTGFTSPTGNIGCFIDRESVRCDIADRDWEPPAKPTGCDLDYGQGIELPAGGAADFVCASDSALDGGEPLPYGQSIAAGTLRCESSEAGMSCSDAETGRGFSLAKEAYELR